MDEEAIKHRITQGDADKLLSSAHRLRWITITVGSIILSIVLGVLAWVAFQEHREIQQLNKHLSSSCLFYADIGSFSEPVSPSPGHQPSALGTKIIVHSRSTFVGQGCQGHLPPAGPGLVKWARVYHLPLIPR